MTEFKEGDCFAIAIKKDRSSTTYEMVGINPLGLRTGDNISDKIKLLESLKPLVEVARSLIALDVFSCPNHVWKAQPEWCFTCKKEKMAEQWLKDSAR